MVHAICRPSQRITTLDVLNGLTLLGLLIAQVYLASPQAVHPLPLDDHPVDLPVQFFMQLLVSGQFERIGSFLFGLGFYRCGQKAGLADPGPAELDANRVARRLLIGLLGIGLSLSLLFKSLDLLAVYALLGFTLLYFRNQSVLSLLTWIMGITGLAIGVPSCLGLLHFAGVSRPSLIDSLNHFSMTSISPGLPKELLDWQRLREWLLPGRSVSPVFLSVISYELMMLGGLLVGKLGMWHRDLKLRVRLALLLLVVFPLALLFKGAWVALSLGLVALPQRAMTYQPVLVALSGFLGTSLLTGVLVVDIGLNARLTPGGWTRWIGQAGQLCLTNYVLQSILCTLLLSGYALAVPGPLPFWGRTSIVVGIYAFQLGFSRLWGKHYRQGPLEWACRQWIYDQ